MRYQGPRGQVSAKGPALTKDSAGREGEKARKPEERDKVKERGKRGESQPPPE